MSTTPRRQVIRPDGVEPATKSPTGSRKKNFFDLFNALENAEEAELVSAKKDFSIMTEESDPLHHPAITHRSMSGDLPSEITSVRGMQIPGQKILSPDGVGQSSGTDGDGQSKSESKRSKGRVTGHKHSLLRDEVDGRKKKNRAQAECVDKEINSEEWQKDLVKKLKLLQLAHTNRQELHIDDVNKEVSPASGLKKGGVSRTTSSNENKSTHKMADIPELKEGEPITPEYVCQMMDAFRDGLLCPQMVAAEILHRSFKLLYDLPNVQDLTIHPKCRLTIVGDLHGQFNDLLTILQMNGLPSERNQYLFNGDFVDRGDQSVEVVTTLLAWKCVYPDAVHLNRGNHEAADINARDGFQDECIDKYQSTMLFQMYCDIFACIPIAAVVQNAIFVVHGGLARRRFTIKELQKQNRLHTVPVVESLIEDLLWSDPTSKRGVHPNSRGAGIEFGKNVVHQFLHANRLRMVIRSHELMETGYEMAFDNRLVTVFSASNYCGTADNDGAYIVFNHTLEADYVQFRAVPSKNLKRTSMKYGTFEQGVVDKLFLRIAAHRLPLIHHYSKVSKDGVSISRQQWADGLNDVLGLRRPGVQFLEFQDVFGLPDRGLNGKWGGPIDFMDFLNRFVPVQWKELAKLIEQQKNGDKPSSLKDGKKGSDILNPLKSSPGSYQLSPQRDSTDKKDANSGGKVVGGVEVPEYIMAIAHLLFTKRYALKTFFRFLDFDGSGVVTKDELKRGLLSLSYASKEVTVEPEHVDVLVKCMDRDGDGVIKWDELLWFFTVLDPSQSQKVKDEKAKNLAKQQVSGSERKE